MATERIVSPGVFIEERDRSQIVPGAGVIGGAFIGPTVKGPAFVPTQVTSRRDFRNKFGGLKEQYYVPYTVDNYLRDSGVATVMRVLGTDGYSLTNPINIVASGSFGAKSIALLHPSYVVTDEGVDNLFESTELSSNANGDAVITLSGSFSTDTSDFTGATNKNGTEYSMSINPNNSNYVGNLFGYNSRGNEPVYNYVHFKNYASEALDLDSSLTLIAETGSSESWDFSNSYLEAETPWITSQDLGGSKYDLFRLKTLSHGVHTNYEFKIGITNIIPAGSVPGSEFGEFTVVVRRVNQDKILNSPFESDDEDTRPDVIEQFTCNLNPNSPKYIARVIGDQYKTVDSNGKITVNGDYPNLSEHIRVEVKKAVANESISPELIPFGFRSLTTPIPSDFTQPASASFVSDQTVNGIYNSNVYYGYDFDFSSTDNRMYLNPLPITAQQSTGSNVDFILSDYNQNVGANYPNSTTPYTGSINLNTSETSTDTRKFIIPFQGGFDGMKPNRQERTGEYITSTNTQGFDISSTSAAGYTAYKKALDTISNPDEFDFNLVVIPGVIHELHSAITNYTITMVEDRADCFYILDGFEFDSNITTAVNEVNTLDTNYAATYYPWVKIRDNDKNKPVWVTPSTVLAGVFAYNDRVGETWFAPAGMNRGGLDIVQQVKSRLTHSERDTLYEARINPIANFTDGIVTWGQKTLQAKPSALSRINVRRLLITTIKFLANQTKRLVFENQTAVLRQQFLNIVTPYFENVQQRQGLTAFNIDVSPDTVNTPDMQDRNILVGEIFIQPTRTVEFIKIPINILPTGVSFTDN